MSENLTNLDYYNIETIKTYYNELYDYILDDLTNNGDSFTIVNKMRLYKDYIDYSKIVFSPELTFYFNKIILGLIDSWDTYNNNYRNEEYLNNYTFYSYLEGPYSMFLSTFIDNMSLLKDKTISYENKAYIMFNKFIEDPFNNINNINNSDVIIMDYLYHYNINEKKPLKFTENFEYYKRYYSQYTHYPEIRIITRFIEKYISYGTYIIKKRKYKNEHKTKYNEVMISLKYHPNFILNYIDLK